MSARSPPRRAVRRRSMGMDMRLLSRHGVRPAIERDRRRLRSCAGGFRGGVPEDIADAQRGELSGVARRARLDRPEICHVGARRAVTISEAKHHDGLPLRPFHCHLSGVLRSSRLPVGGITGVIATVGGPAFLIAWTNALPAPSILAIATESGCRGAAVAATAVPFAQWSKTTEQFDRSTRSQETHAPKLGVLRSSGRCDLVMACLIQSSPSVDQAKQAADTTAKTLSRGALFGALPFDERRRTARRSCEFLLPDTEEL
jgi:hypothetical protein